MPGAGRGDKNAVLLPGSPVWQILLQIRSHLRDRRCRCRNHPEQEQKRRDEEAGAGTRVVTKASGLCLKRMVTRRRFALEKVDQKLCHALILPTTLFQKKEDYQPHFRGDILGDIQIAG